jgi:hypothetical protein
MKNIMMMIVLCLLSCLTHAQKLVEKHFGYSQGKKIKMNIQIADSIRIVTWNKNEVYAKASVDINNNKYNEVYTTGFDESGNGIEIKAHFGENKKYQQWNDSCNCNCNFRSKIYWEVFIPENSEFSVETIDGNITIEGKTDQVKAHTISGFIDMDFAPTRKADLKMSTISGTIYTNVTIEKSRGSRGGNAVNAACNGGGKQVELETISGDIFLRKTDQKN